MGVWARLNRPFFGQKLLNFAFLHMQPIFCPLTGPINILEKQITDKIAKSFLVIPSIFNSTKPESNKKLGLKLRLSGVL